MNYAYKGEDDKIPPSGLLLLVISVCRVPNWHGIYPHVIEIQRYSCRTTHKERAGLREHIRVGRYPESSRHWHLRG